MIYVFSHASEILISKQYAAMIIDAGQKFDLPSVYVSF